MRTRLPRVEGGVLFVSCEQYAAIRASEPDKGGFSGLPAWEALKRLGLTEGELWTLAFKTTRVMVVGAKVES